MKFNVVECYSDYAEDSCAIYDCWAKDVYQLIIKDGKLVWGKLQTKPNKCFKNPKAEICFGDAYGLMKVRRDNLFSFDQKDVSKLNKFWNMHKDDSKRQREKADLIREMQTQMREFISKQVKKLDRSGVAVISSRYSNYPCHGGSWCEEDKSKPYVKDTWFGIAFSCLNRKADSDFFTGEGTALGGWHPGLIVY